jgi:hypothetical protein
VRKKEIARVAEESFSLGYVKNGDFILVKLAGKRDIFITQLK